jgi:hypothetical protein
MPTIETIEGIKINIYFGDHVPPHIHAVYNEHEVLLVIQTSVILAHSLPATQLRKAKSWLTENRVNALQIFNDCNPQLK